MVEANFRCVQLEVCHTCRHYQDDGKGLICSVTAAFGGDKPVKVEGRWSMSDYYHTCDLWSRGCWLDSAYPGGSWSQKAL